MYSGPGGSHLNGKALGSLQHGTRSTHATTVRSQNRAHEKYHRNLRDQQANAAYLYHVDSQYGPPPKAIPKLTAHDKKPAGEKLY